MQVYRPSAHWAWALTSPIWGVLVAWAVAGEPLTWMVVGSSATVAIGIGAATRP